MSDDSGIEPIAIIGMAGRFPGANDAETFWRNLCDGVESIARFSEAELIAEGEPLETVRDPQYVPAKGVLDDIAGFDPAFFNMNAREAEITDPQHRLFLECAWEAIEDAGYDPQNCPKPTGVFAGAALSRYLLELLQHDEAIRAQGIYQTVIGNDKDFLPTRVAYKLNLTGPAIGVQTGCSTSLVAVHLAWQCLINYQCDMALAGAVAIDVPHRVGYLFQEGGIESPDGHCRAFDAAAQGTVGGSGVGIVVLRRLADALAAGDRVIAVIRGSAINNDGARKVGYTAPSVEGQARVIAEALAVAGVKPSTIGYVEAHGTGTPLGDPIEVAALREVFGPPAPGAGAWCGLGSVKTNIGHLDAAAGIAGLIKAARAVECGELPPSLHYVTANPKLELAASPFYVPTTRQQWSGRGSARRRAGVSSFGIGGTNAHVILEEAPARVSVAPTRPAQLLVLSGRTRAAVTAAQMRLAATLSAPTAPPLADVAWTLQTGRQAMAWRTAVVAPTAAAVAAALANAPAPVEAAAGRKVAFLFPGQGTQQPGMAAALYGAEPVFTATVDRCAQLIGRTLDVDVRDLLCGRDAGRLDETAYTQPALFVLSYALAEQWRHWGVVPDAVLGHSIGEYVAACVAGVLTLEEALAAVVVRGQLVQRAPRGAMLAVGLDAATVEKTLAPRAAAGEAIWLSADNAPAWCVIGGAASVVASLEATWEAAGVPVRRLRTSHAFHTGLLDTVRPAFEAHFRAVAPRAPRLPFISNVTGTWLTDVPDAAYWSRHLRAPVQFRAGMAQLCATPDRILLEVGAGQTLTRLARAQAAPGQVALASLATGTDSAALLATLGTLWAHGVAVDWKAVHDGQPRLRVALPTYPFQRERHWFDHQTLTSPVSSVTSSPASITAKREAVADDERLDDLDAWFYVPGWMRSPLELDADAPPPEPGALALVFVDRFDTASETVAALERSGMRVIRVRPGERLDSTGNAYSIDPFDNDHYEQLLSAVGAAGALTRIVWCWGLGGELDDSTRDDPGRAIAPEFHALLLLARALANTTQPGAIDCAIVCDGTHAVTGDEHIDPRRAATLGLSRVLSQELTHIRCRHIDLAPPVAANGGAPARRGAAIAREVLREPAETVIALRGSTRWVQTFDRVRPRPRTRGLRHRGVYVITGGTGRIGLLLAEWLARRVQARVVLIARSGASPHHASATAVLDGDARLAVQRRAIEAIERAGGEVLLLRADLGVPGDFERAWQAATDRYGRIDGVIHAAGVVGEQSMRTIGELTDDDVVRQFAAKAIGTQAIERAAANADLDFFLAFSSIASILGGLGFAAYAAANLYLDALAWRAATGGSTVPLESIGWDGWEFDDDNDRTSIRPSDAEALFERIFNTRFGPHVIVSTTPLDARLRRWTATHVTPSQNGKADGTLHPRPELHSVFVAPRTETECLVADLWSRLLGIGGIGVDDDFFELGGHSLLLTQLGSRLRAELGVPVPLRALFEAPTIAGMVGAIEDELSRQLPDEAAALIAEIQRMSPEEVAAELERGAASHD